MHYQYLSIQIVMRTWFFIVFVYGSQAWGLSLIDSWRDGQNGISGLDGVMGLAISSDDRFVYSAAFNADSIGIYRRSDVDGRLSLVSQVVDEAGGIAGLNGVSALAVSADNGFLYALGSLDNSINVFSRDVSSGIVQLQQIVKQGDPGISGLSTPASLALSADGLSLYVGGDGLVEFSRDASSGLLSFVTHHQEAGTAATNALLLSVDEVHLYSVSLSTHSLLHFQRASNGALSLLRTYVNGLDGIVGMRGAYDLAFNADESLLFVAGSIDNSLVIFDRDASGVLSFKTQVNNTDALVGLRSLLLSPQGDVLYSAANSSGAVASFSLGADVLLSEYLKEGMANINAKLGGVSDLVLDSSGRHLYSAALTSDAISLFSTTATDLRISASVTPSLAALNDVLEFSITVMNQGPSTGNGVVLSGSAPVGLSLESFVPSQGGCTPQNQDFSCNLGSIALGDVVSVKVLVRAVALGTQNLTLSALGGDPDPVLSNNSTVVGAQVISSIPKADLAVELAVNRDPVVIGGDLGYQVTVSNLGTDTAENVQLIYNLPNGSGFSRAVSSQGSCSSPSGGVLRCQLNSVNASSQAQISVELVAPSLATALLASASVSSDTVDPDLANNAVELSSEAVVINGDLAAISLVADKLSLEVGETLTYTAVVMQQTGTLAEGLTIRQQFSPSTAVRFLSASTEYAGAPNQLQPCTLQSTGLIACDLGSVDALAESMTVQVSMMPISAGTLSNSLAVSANVVDDEPTNNQVSTVVTVTGEPVDLAISLSNSPVAPILNQKLDYLVTVRNPSNIATAANVVVRSTVPSGVSYVGALPDQGSCVEDAGNITCGLGDLNPNASVNIRIGVLPTTTETITNSVNVSTNSFDDNELNNQATLALTAGEALADVVLSISADVSSVGVDEPLSYQLSMTNNGPNVANNLQLSQLLADNSVYLSSIVPTGAQCGVVDKTISCQLPQLGVDETVVFTQTVSASLASTLTTTASVAARESDSNPDNNQVSLSTRVNAPPSLFFVESYKDNNADLDGLAGATDLVMSQDGRMVYIAAFQENAVAVYRRDSRSGQLSLLQILRDGQDGVLGLQNPSSLRLSPDQSRLYVTGFGSNTLVVFNRDEQGQLYFVEHIQGPADLSPYGMVTVGRHVYIGSVSGNAVIALTQEESINIAGVYSNGEQGITGLAGVNALAASPDGRYVYAVSISDNALVVFGRDVQTGLLSYQQTLTGFAGLQQAGGLVVSADGHFVYTAGSADNSIGIFRQDQQLSYVSSVTDVLLSGVNGLAISPDQGSLYAAAGNANALLNFRRDDVSGLLSLANYFRNGEDNVTNLTGLRAIQISPAGQHIYAAAITASSVSLFRLPAADVKLEFSATPIQVRAGESVVYNALVRNNGPDGATGVVLEFILAPNLALDSMQSDQGQDCEQNGLNVRCVIGAIANNRSASVVFNTTPQGQGDYQTQVTVDASQADPNPDNNQIQLVSKVIGNANLELNLRSSSDKVVLGGEALTLQAVIVNTGPNDASNVQFTIQGSDMVQANGVDFPAGSCQTGSSTSLNCSIDLLANQAEAVLTLSLIPVREGVASFNAQVSAAQDDPTSPNQASYSLEIASNIISSNRDNQGGRLDNVIITATGVVDGGIVSGVIINQGILKDVTIAADSQITGGGTLSGNIINQGTIIDAVLAPDTQIVGGILSGTIQGNAFTPAILSNLQLSAEAQISQVQLDEGIIFAQGVTLSPSVRFSRNAVIPVDMDLSALLAQIEDPITASLALDLTQDVIQAQSLLDSINALEDVQASGSQFIQKADGIVEITIGDVRFSLLPTSLSQVSPSIALGIYPLEEEMVQMVSRDRRAINFIVAINNPSALQQALQASLTAQSNGNIRVAQIDGYLLLRPQRQSLGSIAESNAANMQTFSFLPTPVSGVEQLQLRYNIQGKTWVQSLGAYPADKASIDALVASVPTLDNFSIDNMGIFQIEVEGQLQRGLLAYRVDLGTSTGNLEFIGISDANGDGVEDYLIRYPNGDSQILYYLP